MPHDVPVPAVPVALRRGLRSEALALKARRVRGHVAPTAWAGVPGSGHDSATVAGFDTADLAGTPGLDHGLCVELSVALLHRMSAVVEEPLLWLTRSGSPELGSPDLTWLSASRIACAELGLGHSFALVTREGWRHEPSGAAHSWKRLRA